MKKVIIALTLTVALVGAAASTAPAQTAAAKEVQLVPKPMF
ncbi:hypothetical protein [Mesobacillus foraminis]|nr:hypothetical protein [Mesobacillus foraminis]